MIVLSRSEFWELARIEDARATVLFNYNDPCVLLAAELRNSSSCSSRRCDDSNNLGGWAVVVPVSTSTILQWILCRSARPANIDHQLEERWHSLAFLSPSTLAPSSFRRVRIISSSALWRRFAFSSTHRQLTLTVKGLSGEQFLI